MKMCLLLTDFGPVTLSIDGVVFSTVTQQAEILTFRYHARLEVTEQKTEDVYTCQKYCANESVCPEMKQSSWR